MRPTLGWGRALVAVGAILAIAGSLLPLPWYTVGGEILPAVRGYGLDGPGVLVFLAAVGMLAVVILPYASRSGRSALDRPVVFAALAGVALAGLVLELATAWNEARLGGPERAPGLWLAGAGSVLAAWGAAELFALHRRTG